MKLILNGQGYLAEMDGTLLADPNASGGFLNARKRNSSAWHDFASCLFDCSRAGKNLEPEHRKVSRKTSKCFLQHF
ncbi:MAG: hypothetical protein WA821_02170 [Anaerolineales bacterium]